MAGFDPAAATAAWISRIPPAVRAAADRHAELQALAWALGWIGPLALAALLLRSGLIEQAARRGGLVVVVLLAVVGCGWAYAVNTIAAGGLPAEGPGAFCLAFAGRAVLLAVALGLVKLAGRRPRLVFGGLAVAASFLLVFGPTAVSEMSSAPGATASGPAAAAALQLARASGVEASSVEVSALAPGEGDVVGLLEPPRLVLTPDAASEASVAEVRAGVGHVLGHWRARDGLSWAAVLASLGVLGVLFVLGLYRPVGMLLGRKSPGPRWRGDERERGLADPRGLPVLWALAALWLALAQPLAFAFDRAANLRADRFSLEHAREPDGLAEVLVRENGSAPVDPPALVLWLVCSHPPLKARIAQAMAWKASHP